MLKRNSMFYVFLVFISLYSCGDPNSISNSPATEKAEVEDTTGVLDHNQRFVIPSNAEDGDTVGEKNANPNRRNYSSLVFTACGGDTDVFEITEEGLITVRDAAKLRAGTFTLEVRTAEADLLTEAVCSIEVLDADECVFVDPGSGLTTYDGTRNAPFLSITEAVLSGKDNILLKRGSVEIRTGNFEPRYRPGILIGAYGKGDRPILECHREASGGKIVSLSYCEGGEVRDIHTRVVDPATVGFITGHSPGSVFDNCVSEGSAYGFRIMIGSDGSKILNSQIFDILADGIYVQHNENIEIGFNTIYDVAQNGNVDGDCVQFSNRGSDYTNTGWYVHHNKLDRSGTVGKFCLILGGNAYASLGGEVGRVEYNWMIGDPDATGSNDSGSLGITNFYLSPVEEISIIGNIFENASNHCIYFTSGTHNVYMENNIFINSGAVAISGANSSDTNLFIRNNLIYECASRVGGTMNNFHGSTVDFKNNICYNSRGDRAYSYGTVTEDYNLFSEGGLDEYGENSIVGTPSFVDADASDFHLELGSLGIDAGIRITDVSTDMDGRSRPLGEGTDMGPYENNR